MSSTMSSTMLRLFSTSARGMVRWEGHDMNKLSRTWKSAVQNFTKPGGSAEKKLGTLKQVTIKSKHGKPVHKSGRNPADKADIISARVFGSEKTKVCHIYKDGTRTAEMGDERA